MDVMQRGVFLRERKRISTPEEPQILRKNTTTHRESAGNKDPSIWITDWRWRTLKNPLLGKEKGKTLPSFPHLRLLIHKGGRPQRSSSAQRGLLPAKEKKKGAECSLPLEFKKSSNSTEYRFFIRERKSLAGKQKKTFPSTSNRRGNISTVAVFGTTKQREMFLAKVTPKPSSRKSAQAFSRPLRQRGKKSCSRVGDFLLPRGERNLSGGDAKPGTAGKTDH